MIEEIYNKLKLFLHFSVFKISSYNDKVHKDNKEENDSFSSNLDHYIMHFKSFDLLSGHGISALYHAPEKEAAKSSPVLSCKTNQQDLPIFLGCFLFFNKVIIVPRLLVHNLTSNTRSWDNY